MLARAINQSLSRMLLRVYWRRCGLSVVWQSPLFDYRSQVLEYCEHHRGEPLPSGDSDNADETRKRTTDISEWDQKFITVDQEMLFEIILAANYLDIKSLLWVFIYFGHDSTLLSSPMDGEPLPTAVLTMLWQVTQRILQWRGMQNRCQHD